MRFVFLLLVSFCVHNAGAQLLITKEQAISDLDTLVKITEEVHYNPYRYISKDAFAQKTDSLKRSLPDTVDTKFFLEKLFSLTALWEDGHASPAISQKVLAAELKKKQFLPLTYVTDEEGRVLVASSGINGLPKGMRLLSVNGLSMEKAKKQATGYIGGLPAWKTEFSNRLFSFFLYLKGVQPPFVIVYEDERRHRKEITVQEGADFTAALSLSFPNLNQPSYTYSVQNEKLGYINFVSMSGSYDNFFRFLDSAFNDMRKKNIQHLAIDLRQNTGGNSNFGEILLAYVTTKKFALSSRKKWKVSRRYKDYLLANGDSSSPYLKMKEGSILETGSCGERERKVTSDSVYTGTVYFLTGPLTFSSANMLADGIKQYKLATLVGEPTGESTNDFGEVFSFTLPNSKIRMNTTTAFDVGADCNEKHNSPVYPDVLIKRSAQHILTNRDPVLEHIWKGVKTGSSIASQ